MRLKSPIVLRKYCKIIWAISMTTKNLYKYLPYMNRKNPNLNSTTLSPKKNFDNTSSVNTL